jgi:hypothetical protein
MRPEILKGQRPAGGRELKTLGIDFALSEKALSVRVKIPEGGRIGSGRGKAGLKPAKHVMDARTVFESTFCTRLKQH